MWSAFLRRTIRQTAWCWSSMIVACAAGPTREVNTSQRRFVPAREADQRTDTRPSEEEPAAEAEICAEEAASYERFREQEHNALSVHKWSECLVDHGEVAEAEKVYRDALEARPKYKSLVLGWAHFLGDQGRAEEAEAALGAAFDADDPVYLAHLGSLRIQRGELSEGQVALAEAKRLGLNSDSIRDCLRVVAVALERTETRNYRIRSCRVEDGLAAVLQAQGRPGELKRFQVEAAAEDAAAAEQRKAEAAQRKREAIQKKLAVWDHACVDRIAAEMMGIANERLNQLLLGWDDNTGEFVMILTTGNTKLTHDGTPGEVLGYAERLLVKAKPEGFGIERCRKAGP